ncbi:MAG: hypothetical protein FWF95_04180 [Syntrophorhabdaceae bacterium]|nr:hypothetical protein [Syntrophorhabdaceae bacterium]
MRNSRGLKCLILLAMGILLLSCGSVGELGEDGPAYIEGSPFANGYSTAVIGVKVTYLDGTLVDDDTEVTWTVEWAENNSPVMHNDWKEMRTGLTWGSSPAPVTSANCADELPPSPPSMTTNGVAIVRLTDIIGEREISVKATAPGGVKPVYQIVRFGDGPLAKFSKIDVTATAESWKEAYRFCNDGDHYPLPPDDPESWSSFLDAGVYRGGRLPGKEELKAVSRHDPDHNPIISARGAALTAGWLEFGDYWWSGVASNLNEAFDVQITSGRDTALSVSTNRFKACLR